VGQILLLAIGSAWFPTILAAIGVILTRPRPAPLLLALYVAGITTSIISGLLILKVVGTNTTKLGGSNDKTSPAFEFVAAVAAFSVAALLGTRKGEALLNRWWDRHKGHKEKRHEGKPEKEKKTPWYIGVLDRGSVAVAAAAGVVLCLPGPFYLLALAEMIRARYSFGEEIVIVLVFNLIMFAFAEIPLVGYAVNPDGTEDMVTRMGDWLKANAMRAIALFVFLWGLICIYKGFHDLAK